MITRLKLSNVRLHADLDVMFSDSDQLVLLAGDNGAGKSTILEAIVYALYGETRHGRRGIADMVRRGAEHEGMQVDLEFTVGADTYTVVRRWEKGKTSATLEANGVVRMRGAGEVTAEVGAILGMDSTGFKLSTIARQKELDGLTDMTAARRRSSINRLLRLDAIAAAASEARNRYNRERDIAAALAARTDLELLAEDLTTATALAEATAAAAADADSAVADIAAELGGGTDIDQAWAVASTTLAHFDGQVEAVDTNIASLHRRLDGVRVPPHPGPQPERSMDSIVSDMTSVAALIAAGESAAQSAAMRAHTEDMLAADDRSATAIAARLAQLSDADTDIDRAAAQVSAASQAHAQAASAARQACEQVAARRAEATMAATALTQAQALSGTCDTCFQPIDAGHRDRIVADRRARADQALRESEDASALAEQSTSAAAEAEAELARARTDAQRVADAHAEYARLTEQHGQLVSQIESRTAALARLTQPHAEDLSELYARRGALAVERAALSEYQDGSAAYERAQVQSEQLRTALDAARRAREELLAARAEAAPDDALQAAFARREQLRADLEVARGSAAQCHQAASGAESARSAAAASYARAEADVAAAAEHRHSASVAAAAASLLSSVATRMAADVRPGLESEISSLLTALSEGRFTSVKVDTDYAVTIADRDGSWQPVGNYSGGEADLIALAIRLALATTVARRHGVGGSGFLILDEVFGSQDSGRREAILSGLRNLRSTYPQILLISHVGGLDSYADRVVDVQALTVEHVR